MSPLGEDKKKVVRSSSVEAAQPTAFQKMAMRVLALAESANNIDRSVAECLVIARKFNTRG